MRPRTYHADKLGLLGSLATLACCLGFGPAIALLSAVGATFILTDAVLAPLFVGFATLGALGLVLSFRVHRRWPPLALHAASGATVFVFTFVRFAKPLIWIGAAGLVGAAIWDAILKRRAAKKESSDAPQPG